MGTDIKLTKIGFAILISLLFASVVIPTYSFGTSNHNEQIPIILRTIDEKYLENDWFVNQNDGFSPRYYYSILMASIAGQLGLPIAFYVIYITSLVSLLTIISLISLDLFKSYFAPIVTLSLIVYGPITISNILGGDWLIYNLLIPASIALPLTVLSTYFFLKKKFYLAFIILGVVTFVHPLEGLLITCILALCLLILVKSIDIIKKTFCLGVYAIIACVALLPVITFSSNIQNLQIFEVITSIRHPHHYCPFSFPPSNYIIFLEVFAVFLGLILWKAKTNWSDKDTLFSLFFSTGIGLLVIGTIFVEILPVPLIGKLQLFRLAPYLVLVMYLYIGCGASQAVRIFVRKIRNSNYKLSDNVTQYSNVLLLVGLVFVTLIFVNAVFNTSYLPATGPRDPMYDWIKLHTPEDAIFLIDPSIEDFRLRAERAIVIDWKAFPFQDEAVIGWWKRIQDVTNHGKGYNTLDETELAALCEKHGASFILIKSTSDLNLTTAYEDANYRIYSI